MTDKNSRLTGASGTMSPSSTAFMVLRGMQEKKG